MRLFHRLFPHPFLTLTLVVVWLMLVNTVSAGHLVLGLILGAVIPLLTAPFWPARPKIRRFPTIVAYVSIVLYDIVKANVHVAWLVLFVPAGKLRSRFVTVPLSLTTPEAITVLAGTITMTPGTVSADVSADGRALLVHCLDAPDDQAVVDEIKQRYEARLKEIFE
ncbi:MAG: Na+/H+ antiporter subunit E [Marivibrio sp.]|uniref:Na+/H+ antiporter subunit E n=1 Tax=Marivibrio sp. TaxID=2039719 RepID=UPI0032EDF82D